MTRRDAVVVDVDGTLCHYSSDRANRARDAQPREDVIELVRALWLTGYSPIFVSARPIQQYQDTDDWIHRHLDFLSGLSFANLGWLHLRDVPLIDDNDGYSTWVSDTTWKTQLYREVIEPSWNVRLVLDDLPRCVNAWNALGLTTLQVTSPDWRYLAVRPIKKVETYSGEAIGV